MSFVEDAKSIIVSQAPNYRRKNTFLHVCSCDGLDVPFTGLFIQLKSMHLVGEQVEQSL
jgi:hypothetical protein